MSIFLLSRRNDTDLFLVGEMRVGEMRVGEMRVGEMRVGEMRVGEMKVGEVRVGEMRVGERDDRYSSCSTVTSNLGRLSSLPSLNDWSMICRDRLISHTLIPPIPMSFTWAKIAQLLGISRTTLYSNIAAVRYKNW